MTDYLISGADVLGRGIADIAISEGTIVDPELLGDDHEVVDATGLIALPGLVDIHTHLREPGREDAETVETGTRAAARGGFTAVFAMANSDPVADTAGVVEQVWRLGRDAGWCDVHPVGAVTVGLAGEALADLGAMADSQARVRMFSDDGMCVHDAVLMRRALEYVKSFGGFVAQHAQEPNLTAGAQMNESELSGVLGLAGWPAVAEEAIIARDVLLAQHVDSRLHVCHVSTAGSVELIRWAKAQGVAVTAEVTPHHLLLTDELVRTFDPVYKVNPPLRTDRDVQALREALADGTIDVVGTDHAPHTAEHKCSEWSAAAMGMVGMETALAVIGAHAGKVDGVKISLLDDRKEIAMRRRLPGNEEAEDPARTVQMQPFSGRLMRGQQRLNPVHVRVHAAIGGKDLPVARELVAEQARVIVPEPILQHLRGIRQQPVGIGMACQLRRRCGQQDKDMAIGQLGPVRHRPVPQRPDIAAVPAVAMPAPQQIHPPVDDPRPVRAPGHLPQGKGMDQPRGRVQFLHSRQGSARRVQRDKAIRPGACVKEIQRPARIPDQPGAVDRIVQP